MIHLRTAAFAAAAVLLGAAGPALAQAPVEMNGAGIFPESISSTSDGTLYIGSIALSSVFKAEPGAATAEPWIGKEAGGFAMVLGVLADEANGNLWVCTGTFGDPTAPPTELKSFDLATGAAKQTFVFPGEQGAAGICNDIVVAPDGTVLATDTAGGRILALAPGASELALWAHDAQFENGLDGLAFDGGALYVNNVTAGTLFRVDVNADGTAGAITKIEPSQALAGPDGMRAAANGGIWVAENASGRISHLAFSGDTATVAGVKEGLEAPTGMTQVGDWLWPVEAKFAYMFGDKAGQDPGKFILTPIPANGM